MAVTLDASNIQSISTCESTTNWSSSNTIVADGDNLRQGTYSIGLLKVSNQTSWAKFDYYTANSSTYLNISSGTRHIYIWICSAQPHFTTQIRITAEDSSAVVGYWNVVTAVGQYKGGWKCFVVDTQRAFDTGSPNRSAIRYIGMTITYNAKVTGNVNNVWVDFLHSATGPLLIKGGGVGTEGTFEELYAASEATTTAYGFLVQQEGSYAIQGPLQFGDNGTGSSYFEDSNQILIGANILASSSWITLSTVGNSTGTNSFVLGEKSGVVGINGCVFKSASSTAKLVFDFTNTNMNTLAIYGSTFIAAGTIDFPVTGGTLRECLSSSFIGCGEISPSTMPFQYFSVVSPSDRGINIESESHAVSDGSIITAPDGLNFPTAGEYDLTNVVFTGCTYDVEFSGTGDLVINLDGSNPSTYEMTGGGSSVTFNNPVTTQITVKDVTTGDPIEGARVLLWVADDTNFPYHDSVTITGSGTTATVSHTSHGLKTGDNVIIQGAVQDVYNGGYSITYVSANSYTYTTSETITVSPATGTIIATFAFINETTTALGVADDSRTVLVDQPVLGWARQSSSSPYYQQGSIVGTVDSETGLSLVVQLVPDE